MKLLFFHGLESGPHGNKFRVLKERHPEITSPDFEGVYALDDRMVKAEHVTRGHNVFIVGSSFGGLVAALLAHRFPERVAGYLLCAPALHWEEANEVSQVPEHAALIHGTDDSVVPIQASRDFAKNFDLPLHEVGDGHRLQNSRQFIAEITGQMISDIA